MTKLIATSAVAAVLFIAAVADANAWTRNRSVTGWRGTATVQGSGSCANGTCSRQVTRTGPYGNSVTRQGTTTCTNGSCSRQATRTGPYGNTVTRQGTATCANGVCTGSRTTTGPRGNSVTRTGSISR